MSDAELERLQERWEQGDFRAVAEAFSHLSWQEPEWPEWIRSAVLEALAFAFENAGAAGKGKKGGHLVQAKRADVDAMRWSIAKMCLGGRAPGETRPEAFARAQEMLAGSFAQGSPQAIEKSYERHAKSRQIRG